MKVKYVNDNITIKELSENHWNGCKYHTLKFINAAKINEEYEAKKGYNGNYFKVFIDNEEYFVNVKLFEIIEEPKKIEKLDITLETTANGNLHNYLMHDGDKYAVSMPYRVLNDKLDEIINYINSKEDNNE